MSIEAYVNSTSVVQGSNITFYISPNSSFDITIAAAWDEFNIVHNDSGSTGNYPTNSEPWENGCGWENYYNGYSWQVPANLKSGPYIASFTETASGAASGYNKVLFFVKSANPGINSKILFASAVNTEQAYNSWGGKSLYDYNSTNNQRAQRVSFNRPTRQDIFDFELPLIKWLFNNTRYEVDFCTNVDIHADPTILTPYKLFLSVGHDEYWSAEMRDNIDNFIGSINAGNLAFFSGNVCWWKINYYDQTWQNRQIECLKEESDNWINTNRPETLMTGVSFYFGAYYPGSRPPTPYMASLNKHWLFKDTGINPGDTFGLYNNGTQSVVGYETDGAAYINRNKKFPYPTGEKQAPMDFMILARANCTGWAVPEGGYSGPDGHSGWATIGIFRKRNGGFGFTVGTTDWAYGLQEDVNVDKLTRNVLDTLGTAFEAQKFLIQNPDFETWQGSGPQNEIPVGWYKEGAGSILKAMPGYNSSNCLFINSEPGQTWVSQYYIPVRTNRQYKVKCMAKGSDPTGGPQNTITIRLQTTDDYTEFAIASYTGTTEWEEISAIGTIVDQTNDILRPVRVKIQVSTGYSAYFDEIVIEEL